MNYKEIIGKAREFADLQKLKVATSDNYSIAWHDGICDLLQYLEALSPESLKEVCPNCISLEAELEAALSEGGTPRTVKQEATALVGKENHVHLSLENKKAGE